MEEPGKDFLEQLKAGNELSYKRLFIEYYPSLCVFAKKYLRDVDSSKEIVQGLFVKLYEDREKINLKSSLKSYLYQSVKNRCLNYLKHNKVIAEHHAHIKLAQQDEIQDWTELMLETELESKIYDIVAGLPEQCRRIYKMSRIDGIKNSEIADKLNISIRTVETQISKALKVLRIGLKNYLEIILCIIISLNI